MQVDDDVCRGQDVDFVQDGSGEGALDLVFGDGGEEIEVVVRGGAGSAGGGDVCAVEEGGVGLLEVVEGADEVVFSEEGERLETEFAGGGMVGVGDDGLVNWVSGGPGKDGGEGVGCESGLGDGLRLWKGHFGNKWRGGLYLLVVSILLMC